MKPSHPLPGLRRLFATFVLSVLTAHAAHAGTAFSKIVVFGDSLNDSGNLHNLTGGAFPAAPAYVDGRQSNGPVWVEYLADQLGLADRVENQAVVGALTKATPEIPTGNVWSDTFPGLEGTDVASQVSGWLARSNGVADPEALYILEGGANDFTRVANPGVIVFNLVDSFARLQAGGARHIIVANLPDIGKTPRVLLAEQYGYIPAGTAALLSAGCAQLNTALAHTLAVYTAPGVSVTIADFSAFMNNVVAYPAAYGLSNVTLPYLLAGNGSDPATWMFWDDLHPTTRVHEFLASDVAHRLLRTYLPAKGKTGQGAINSLNGLAGAPGR